MLEGGEGFMEALRQTSQRIAGTGAEQGGCRKSHRRGPETCAWPIGGTSRGPGCELGYSHVGPLCHCTEFTFYAA